MVEALLMVTSGVKSRYIGNQMPHWAKMIYRFKKKKMHLLIKYCLLGKKTAGLVLLQSHQMTAGTCFVQGFELYVSPDKKKIKTKSFNNKSSNCPFGLFTKLSVDKATEQITLLSRVFPLLLHVKLPARILHLNTTLPCKEELL
ncbi:hypothetical protein FKM82_014354 [Ascaphus truei]